MPQLILVWISAATSECLETCILWRAARARMLGEYSYFCAYIASTLTALALPIVYVVDRRSYNHWYWTIQFVTLALGCGIILEIFRHVLAPYPGAERLAKIVAVAGFAVVFCLSAIDWAFGLQPFSPAAGIQLERNVRAVQAILLFAILAIIFWYRVPVGRNVSGVILGYGSYIAASLISRAVEAYAGAWLRLVWIYVQPLMFGVSLVIWVIAMWSYHANPTPDHPIAIEDDYEALADRTRQALKAIRSYFGRVTRV